MAKKTKKSSNGASFHGTSIYVTPAKLMKLFPDSYYEDNTGQDKVNYDFCLENDNGDVFTIYDWKEYRKLKANSQYEFHIGGKNSSITEQAARELRNMI